MYSRNTTILDMERISIRNSNDINIRNDIRNGEGKNEAQIITDAARHRLLHIDHTPSTIKGKRTRPWSFVALYS